MSAMPVMDDLRAPDTEALGDFVGSD